MCSLPTGGCSRPAWRWFQSRYSFIRWLTLYIGVQHAPRYDDDCQSGIRTTMMTPASPRRVLIFAAALLWSAGIAAQTTAVDWQISRGGIGRRGGQLVIAQRTEPRTLNPITAVDS